MSWRNRNGDGKRSASKEICAASVCLCKARGSLTRMCRLARVVALETWKKEVVDEDTWRRFDWDTWRRFYWVLELEGEAMKRIIQRVDHLDTG